MKKIKILFLIPNMKGGGAEKVIATIVKKLDRTKFDVSLGVVDGSNAVYLSEIPDDVVIKNFECKRVRYALPNILLYAWRHRPDVIFSTLGYLNVALLSIKSFLPAGIIYIARETTIPSSSQKSMVNACFWRFLYKFIYRRADLLICQSHAMKSDLVDCYAFPGEKAIVINNPLDIDRVKKMAESCSDGGRLKSDGLSFVSAGRLTKVKGFDILIEAIALLGDKSVHVEIFGDGPLRDNLENQVFRFGLSEQIKFKGFDVNPYSSFAAADAFILSSRYEGFPNVVLESLACGTPVISTPAIGGVKEIIESIDECLIAESISAESLAEAVRKWISGPRKNVPINVVEPYAVERIVRQYEDAILSVI